MVLNQLHPVLPSRKQPLRLSPSLVPQWRTWLSRPSKNPSGLLRRVEAITCTLRQNHTRCSFTNVLSLRTTEYSNWPCTSETLFKTKLFSIPLLTWTNWQIYKLTPLHFNLLLEFDNFRLRLPPHIVHNAVHWESRQRSWTLWGARGKMKWRCNERP